MTIVGARGPRMDLKSCSMTVEMSQSTGPRRKDAQGEQEMSQSTLRDSKWEQESKERERESVVIGEVTGLE